MSHCELSQFGWRLLNRNNNKPQKKDSVSTGGKGRQTQSNKYIQNIEIAVQSKGMICVILCLPDYSFCASEDLCPGWQLPSARAWDSTDVSKLDKGWFIYRSRARDFSVKDLQLHILFLIMSYGCPSLRKSQAPFVATTVLLAEDLLRIRKVVAQDAGALLNENYIHLPWISYI